MKILRVDMTGARVWLEDLKEEWQYLGGSALIAKIMREEVPPTVDPLGADNRFIVCTGPLAGTGAPQLGRISVGAKSPLTRGIKEANSGGPAGQILDRLGIRSIIVQGAAKETRFYCLYISKEKAELVPADEYRSMKNYALADALKKRYGAKIAIVSIGIAGESKYRGASVSFTDIFGDPSRNAARGGLGAVMGSKGLKAIVIDPSGAAQVMIEDREKFRETVKSWVHTLTHDISCSLFSRFGTPFAISNSASHASLVSDNYRSGRPGNVIAVSGDRIQQILFERGGKMHGCMPGCVVQCSIIYPDKDGTRLCAAYEYETIALLGTNLGITDPDAIARLKFMCDDLGVDAVETGSSLGVAAEAGKMTMGDWRSAARLLDEIERNTELGRALGNGVVATAEFLKIDRVPAYKGQALPAHDPRSVKGTGVTYFTSPMGADHTAGLTYRMPRSKSRQRENSLQAQIRAATCDAYGYCLNSLPGGRASIYQFFADLMNARYGIHMTPGEIMETGKQTLRDQLAFNEKAEFSRIDPKITAFVREEAVSPTGQTFDVDEAEIADFWKGLDSYREKEKVWEIRMPQLPDMLFGTGVVQTMADKIRGLNITKALLITDPVMKSMGRAGEVAGILESRGISSVIFSEVEPDPPIDLIERVGKLYSENECDGIVGLGGGSSMDTTKAVGLRATHQGEMREYESIVGGTAKIRPVIPPLVCIPTTSGTGSEVNPYAVITDKERDLKFMLMSNYFIPKLAVIDPLYCKTMPPGLTVESGIDALAHCIEGYVSLAIPYHPYFEAMAVYGVKLIGRSLVRAYRDGNDIAARSDMCFAAVCGGLGFLKGLGLGHALTHVLGAHYHLPHGRAATYGLLCFVKANKDTCKEQFADLAHLLNRSSDLENGLREFYERLDIRISLKAHGISRDELKKIAFLASRDAVNMATDPTSIGERKIYELLTEVYE
jgi:aldehyde:ferredoxin oxidoreductase